MLTSVWVNLSITLAEVSSYISQTPAKITVRDDCVVVKWSHFYGIKQVDPQTHTTQVSQKESITTAIGWGKSYISTSYNI